MVKTTKYALISVFDKTNIIGFAKQISNLGYKIISTGGTAKVLEENRIPIISIEEITGNPESFDGRMKTISFQIESGILFDRSKQSHVRQAHELKVPQIDIVVCNLYPFEQTIAKAKVKLDDAIENIDVGGPTMIRAAAKNFKNVIVVIDPKDYEEVTLLLHRNRVDESFRRKLAAKAFAHLSLYDSQIANYLTAEEFPDELTIPLRKIMDLRYGENPHQKSSVYLYPNTNSPFGSLTKKWGRNLSLTNITDINAGLESVKMFGRPCAVVIKHNCPCGIAIGKTPHEALNRAIQADPESAFGGIIVMNRPMDLQTAKIIGAFKEEKHANIDIVAVPEISNEALDFLSKVRKTMGIYTFGDVILNSVLQNEGSKRDSSAAPQNDMNIKWIDGGLALQTIDDVEESLKAWKVVTKKKPSAKQISQMKVAWKFISRIKSNAIIVVDKEIPMTRGIGTGQTSRIRSVKIALEQAGKYARGAILASDSFFPFDDSVKLATKAGIACIVQQGGSINDQASIDAANKAGIAMVFTNRRAFWH